MYSCRNSLEWAHGYVKEEIGSEKVLNLSHLHEASAPGRHIWLLELRKGKEKGNLVGCQNTPRPM